MLATPHISWQFTILVPYVLLVAFFSLIRHFEPANFYRKAYELAIDLGPVSNLFGQGHRIRLDVTGSSFPRLEPLPAKATSSVYHEAQRASYLELPVIGR